MPKSSRLVLAVLILTGLPAQAIALNPGADPSLVVWDFLAYAVVASAITLLVVQAHRPRTRAVDRILVIVDWSAIAVVAGFFVTDTSLAPFGTQAGLAALLLGGLVLSTWIADDNPLSTALLSGILVVGVGLSFAPTAVLASDFQIEEGFTSPVEHYDQDIEF